MNKVRSCVDWIRLALDRVQLLASLKSALHFRFQETVGKSWRDERQLDSQYELRSGKIYKKFKK
jgi:hypothetical protein